MSMNRVQRIFQATGLLVCLSFSDLQAQPLRWFKGNTHTHTLNSDGDSTPLQVAEWYREHDYNFLVLSDHNSLTEIQGLNAIMAAPDQFLLIPGEEVTDHSGEKPVHLTGINILELVSPLHGPNPGEILDNNVNAIRSANGIAQINHPNFEWSLKAEDLLHAQNARLIEIFNGHPTVHNLGGGGLPSVEQMWDEVLTSGKIIHAVASDDAHHFKGEFEQDRANPGRGWLMVRAAKLTASSVVEALEKGNFYASTGVTLADYQVTPKEILVQIAQRPSFKYSTSFIGESGRILEVVHGPVANYRFKGNEKYVRARVIDSMGKTAWTQPAFLQQLKGESAGERPGM